MYGIKEPRCIERDSEIDRAFKYTKKEILSVLKDQKVSLSRARTLFKDILDDIENNNVITL